MSILAAYKGATAMTKVGVGLIPVALTLAIPLAWKVSGSLGETRGYDSRNEAFTELTDKVAELEQGLLDCAAELDDIKIDNNDLTKKLAAQAEEHGKAVTAQAQSTRAAQQATNRAMELLAQQGQSRDAYFENLAGQLKGLSYEVDENGRCIVRGGGSILRNASRGKKE